MGSNNFTKNYSDGSALTEAMLTTAYQSLTVDIANTTQLTSGSTSGQFLKSTGDSAAATWALPLDPLGPSSIRNYGLSTSVSSGALSVALKTNSGGNGSTSDPIDVPFSNNGATTATYTALQVTSALSFTITASATLGFTGTSTNRVFIYALNNTGTVRLGVSARSDLDSGATVTPVAMSSAADSQTALYATATTAVVCRLLGWVDSAMNSSKQWQASSHCGVVNSDPNFDRSTLGGSSVGANRVIDAYTRTNVAGSATAAVRSVAISASCGTFACASNTSAQTVTNLVVSLTTSGRPVHLMLQGDGTSPGSYLNIEPGFVGYLAFFRDGALVARHAFQTSSGTASCTVSPSAFAYFDAVAAGTYKYTIVLSQSGGSAGLNARSIKLVAYEL